MKQLILPFVAISLLSGCAAIPPAISIASMAMDVGSYAVSGKTVTDHGISFILDSDCAMIRVLESGSLCQDEMVEIEQVAVLEPLSPAELGAVMEPLPTDDGSRFAGNEIVPAPQNEHLILPVVADLRTTEPVISEAVVVTSFVPQTPVPEDALLSGDLHSLLADVVPLPEPRPTLVQISEAEVAPKLGDDLLNLAPLSGGFDVTAPEEGSLLAFSHPQSGGWL